MPSQSNWSGSATTSRIERLSRIFRDIPLNNNNCWAAIQQHSCFSKTLVTHAGRNSNEIWSGAHQRHIKLACMYFSSGFANTASTTFINAPRHSTPSQDLFSKPRCDFSHGCIRVEHAEELAAWILRAKPGWTIDRIQAWDEWSANRSRGPG